MKKAEFTTDPEGLKKIIDYLLSSENKTLEENNKAGRDVFFLVNAEAIYNLTKDPVVNRYNVIIESKNNKPTSLHVDSLTELIRKIYK